MKKLLLTSFVLLLPLLTSSQEKSTIKVSAHAIHKESSPTFKALIAVSGAYSSLPDELLTLDNLKTKLKEAIQKKGIPWSDLKENPNDFGYETIRFDQEGTIYEYVTSDISAMKKFLQIKTLGLQQLSSVCTFTCMQLCATVCCGALPRTDAHCQRVPSTVVAASYSCGPLRAAMHGETLLCDAAHCCMMMCLHSAAMRGAGVLCAAAN